MHRQLWLRLALSATILPLITLGCDQRENVTTSGQALTKAECNFFDVNGTVRICHATASTKNPYTILMVANSGCVNGHVGHANDYVATATDLNCKGGGCFPVGAPVDPKIPCCEGLANVGGYCTDINECVTNNGGCAQTCTNSVGSYACSCDSGYTLNADAKGCTDINECVTNNGGCTQTCTNSVGSYACSCDSGYTLNADGKSCGRPGCPTNNGPGWDLDADFSATANPNGQWRYGWTQTLGSTFVDALPFAWLGFDAWGITGGSFSLPGFFRNTTSHPILYGQSVAVQPCKSFFHPGPQSQLSVLRWVAPARGHYLVNATFTSIHVGTTSSHVLLNEREISTLGLLFSYTGAPNIYSETLDLQAGDTLDFAVGSQGSYNADSTGISVHIKDIAD